MTVVLDHLRKCRRVTTREQHTHTQKRALLCTSIDPIGLGGPKIRIARLTWDYDLQAKVYPIMPYAIYGKMLFYLRVAKPIVDSLSWALAY